MNNIVANTYKWSANKQQRSPLNKRSKVYTGGVNVRWIDSHCPVSLPNIHMCIFVSLFIFVIFLYLCHFPSAGPPMPGERSCSIAALNLSVFHNFYAQHSLTPAHPSISCISPFILRLLTFTVYTWYLFIFFLVIAKNLWIPPYKLTIWK